MNSDFYQNIRRRALKGEKNHQCQKCYIEEQHGLVSERLVGLDDFPENFKSTTTSLQTVRHLEAFVGRTCNLKCHSCHPQVSSKWEEDYRIAQWPWEKPRDSDVNYDQILKIMKDLRHIKIIGGEPSLSKKTMEILSSVNSTIRKEITVEISTNGTHLFSAEMLGLLSKYKKVLFNISVDGYGKLNETIRYPSNWAFLDKNIDHYIQWAMAHKSVYLILHCTVGALNVFSLQNLEEWWQQKTTRWNSNRLQSRYALLTHPESMYIKHLPQHLKEIALNRLPRNNQKFVHIHSLLENEKTRTPHYFEELLNYCLKLDEIRKTNLSETVPELFL